MTTPDWATISTIASTVTIIMGGFLWVTTRVFNLGKTSQRLYSIESDLASFKREVNEQFKAVRSEINAASQRLDHRMDKLILTISESNARR